VKRRNMERRYLGFMCFRQSNTLPVAFSTVLNHRSGSVCDGTWHPSHSDYNVRYILLVTHAFLCGPGIDPVNHGPITTNRR
jgi:hypothetical protein